MFIYNQTGSRYYTFPHEYYLSKIYLLYTIIAGILQRRLVEPVFS